MFINKNYIEKEIVLFVNIEDVHFILGNECSHFCRLSA